MSDPLAPPPRRRMTLVRAVKNSITRAASTREISSGGDSLTGRSSSTLPNSLRSTPHLTRSSSSQSGRSFDSLTRNSSVESVGAAVDPFAGPQARRLPQQDALPTPNFYVRFPRSVGPVANVLIASPEEYKMFCHTARSIKVVCTKEERNVAKDRLSMEDIAAGGFFVYQPNSPTPQYFLLHDKKVDVYGTASYISR